MAVSKDSVTVVIPTYREEEAIGAVLDELSEEGYRNILVVDGYSEDRTVEIARSRGVEVIYQEGRGKADAVKTGIKYVKTPYLVVMDGDHSYDPRDIEKLLKYVDTHDEVIGVRDRKNISLLHRFGNRVITKIFNTLFGTNLRDVCSGMYLLKTDIAKEIDFESRGFGAEVEIAAHIASTGGRIGEADISYRKRLGESKLKYHHGFSILFSALKLTLKYNPVFLFLAVSSLALIPGLAIVGYVAYKLLFLGVKHHIWAIIGVMISGVGFIALLLALVVLYIKRFEYRV
ncbi:MAG: glycosyltransferase family 2 protein, partial [Candidatus Nezhaarchaeota archaeon]|nr:glycosyltransferase family 2 protein [Candidatus Nezhaarchaeota archaeon]